MTNLTDMVNRQILALQAVKTITLPNDRHYNLNLLGDYTPRLSTVIPYDLSQ